LPAGLDCCDCCCCRTLFVQGDQLYIQMELCGDSLAAMARLRDRKPWREAEMVGLLKQVCAPWSSAAQGLRRRHTHAAVAQAHHTYSTCNN
jgi:hypothetical protein